MVKIDVHVIFHIRYTSVEIYEDDLPRVFKYVGGILNGLGSIPIIVGGVSDHLHLLSSLPSQMAIADLVRITKAKSSKWIKGISPAYAAFAWQDGYGAFSVSPSILGKTISYIENQKYHHRRMSFAEELKALLEAYHVPHDDKSIVNYSK